MWWYSLLRQRFSSSHSRDEIVWPSRIPTTHWREQSRHWSHNFWKWTSKLARSKCSQLKPLCVRSHCLLWQPTALPMWMPLQNEQFAWSHVCRQWGDAVIPHNMQPEHFWPAALPVNCPRMSCPAWLPTNFAGKTYVSNANKHLPEYMSQKRTSSSRRRRLGDNEMQEVCHPIHTFTIFRIQGYDMPDTATRM